YVKYAKEIFGRSPSDPTQDLTTQLCKLGLALNSDKYFSSLIPSISYLMNVSKFYKFSS
ncbi:hypothetical protein AAMO2058_000907200, partial [Amorphochlora amoebiformis]